MNKWTWLVLGAFLIWGIISWNWYVCGVKGLCEFEKKVVMQDDSSISIGDIDQEVAERDDENVQGRSTASTNVTTRKVTSTREIVIECDAHLDTYLRLGYQNSSVEMEKLEEFLNKYEDEELEVNGVFESSDEAAVMRFQEKNREAVLTPWGLENPTGYVYQTTRDHINRLYCAYTAR